MAGRAPSTCESLTIVWVGAKRHARPRRRSHQNSQAQATATHLASSYCGLTLCARAASGPATAAPQSSVGDVRCTTAVPPKADVHPRSCYVAFVPQADFTGTAASGGKRSEEHTSELQSRENLVCR